MSELKRLSLADVRTKDGGFLIDCDTNYPGIKAPAGSFGYKPYAELTIAAVNACMEINPDNPIAAAEAIAAMYDTLEELVHVADLRGDSVLPNPEDDPKMWTARMQAAWDGARDAIKGVEARQ